MLAFYGKKGSPMAGLIQEVAIEAGRSVADIPTWMGLTARWRVKCVSLTEARRNPGRVQETRTRGSKAGAAAVSATTRLPAPTLRDLHSGGTPPAPARWAYARASWED